MSQGRAFSADQLCELFLAGYPVPLVERQLQRIRKTVFRRFRGVRATFCGREDCTGWHRQKNPLGPRCRGVQEDSNERVRKWLSKPGNRERQYFMSEISRARKALEA